MSVAWRCANAANVHAFEFWLATLSCYRFSVHNSSPGGMGSRSHVAPKRLKMALVMGPLLGLIAMVAWLCGKAIYWRCVGPRPGDNIDDVMVRMSLKVDESSEGPPGRLRCVWATPGWWLVPQIAYIDMVVDSGRIASISVEWR